MTHIQHSTPESLRFIHVTLFLRKQTFNVVLFYLRKNFIYPIYVLATFFQLFDRFCYPGKI